MANGLFNLKQVVQAVQQGGWPAQKTPAVEYLVVAGGGGGGYIAGGGGAGGLLVGIDPVPNGQTLLVTVGSGGAGGTGGAAGASGTNSVFGAISSTGGGGGGASSSASPGLSGGSGGGANVTGGGGTTTVAGQGVAGQGNAGGLSTSSSNYTGGGGGGAGTVGLASSTAAAGNGGAGIASAINGTVTVYAGGGGGAADTAGVGGSGGVGGGGAGGISRGATGGSGTVNGVSGSANTGGGGGGYGVAGAGGTGGSGIVIVSYPDVYAAATSTTGSPTVSTSGSGSIAFNGSTQFIQYASNSAFNLGSGNFTIEMWAYRSAGGSQVFAGQNNSGLGARIFDIGIDASNLFNGEVFVGGTGYTISSSTTMNISTWYHIALVRNSTVMTLYINGTSVGTVTVAGSVTSGSTPMTIGRLGDYNGYYTNGYISNFRYVVGTALYTSNFTPSTSPLTAVSGTQLLMNSVSGAYLADGSTNSFAPASTTVAGSWNQLSPFTGTGYKNRVYTWTSSGSITF
jgi:hypothetical protein